MAYPLLTRSLPSPKQERLLTAIATAEAARSAGSIANVQYQSVKETINRALETATAYDNANGWSSARWNHSRPQLHTIAGFVKKLRSDDNVTLRAFVQEIAPLGDLFAALKEMVTKRQPKPVEERQSGYHPPAVSTVAQQQVVTLLEQVTETSYQELRAQLISYYSTCVSKYLEYATLAFAHDKLLSPYDFFMQRRIPMPAELAAVDRVVDQQSSRQFAAKADWQARIADYATQEADEIRNAFVHKNFRKIASIIDAKGNYTQGRAIEHTVSLGGLRGSFEFAFADDSRFVAINQVVYVRNNHGTRFQRYPLTFHNVMLPTGQRMPQPSEARMNQIFAQA